MKPQRLCLQVSRPRGDFPGEVAYHFYIVENGAVTLTDDTGKPLSEAGHQFTHQLADGENPRRRAFLLTKLRHRSVTPRGFNRQIVYPKSYNV
jgi:hypothetical protein